MSQEVKREEEISQEISQEERSQESYIDIESQYNEEHKEPKPMPKYLESLKDKLSKMNTPHHIKLDTIFDTVQDANTIFQMEKKTYDFVINLNKMLIAIIVILLILIICLFPLKEKEPYLIGFSNATQNFVHIEKANETITANEALIRSLIGSYILNRETINHFDDQERYEVVRMQSSTKVWKIFENIVAQDQSVYGNSQLTRVVKVVNIAKWKNGYVNAEVAISLYALGQLQSQKRYKITIMYKFNTIDIDFESLPKNPTGFEVQEYAVTEIATIKELEEENKVDPKTQKSKIKKPDTSDSNDFLKQYQYNDPTKNQESDQPQAVSKESNRVSAEEYNKMDERQKRQVLITEMKEAREKQKQAQERKKQLDEEVRREQEITEEPQEVKPQISLPIAKPYQPRQYENTQPQQQTPPKPQPSGNGGNQGGQNAQKIPNPFL